MSTLPPEPASPRLTRPRPPSHSPAARLHVFDVRDDATAQHVVEAGVDVLGEVDAARGLGDAAVCEAEKLVEDVWVAVVEPHAQRVPEDALRQRDEAALLQKKERRQQRPAVRNKGMTARQNRNTRGPALGCEAPEQADERHREDMGPTRRDERALPDEREGA
eukprot:3512939-Pleurochrysis_carterae.AAC.1